MNASAVQIIIMTIICGEEYNRINIYKPWSFISVIISKAKMQNPQSVPSAAKLIWTHMELKD